mgnify:CR=1 FL=1
MDNNYQNKISEFYQSKKRMPSYSEMMKIFGFKSKNAVYRLVNKMIDADLVKKDSTGKLIPNKIFGELPMLGLVKAGLPSFAEEQVLDTTNLEDLLVHKKDSTYILEVDGDSMIDAHIAKGDFVLAERTNNAKDGQIVIAEVDGEFTMKYFKTNGKKTWLEAANKNYKDIHPTQSLEVVAVVVGVMRKY